MKLGTETGSLVNHIASRSVQPQPEVGMGATVCGWTDRHPATIVKVTRCQVHIQEDRAERTDSNGMSECQSYAYSRNPDAPVIVFRKTKRGWRDRMNHGLVIGRREKYYDYSF